jgi:hypothetical protein
MKPILVSRDEHFFTKHIATHDDYFDTFNQPEGFTYKTYLSYHENWNELMPVVEKINTIIGSEFGVTITGNRTTIESCYGTYELWIEQYTGSTLFNTYNAIVEFIKWYNENNLTPRG